MGGGGGDRREPRSEDDSSDFLYSNTRSHGPKPLQTLVKGLDMHSYCFDTATAVRTTSGNIVGVSKCSSRRGQITKKQE